MAKTEEGWDGYWKGKNPAFSKICAFCRKSFISSYLAATLDDYFPKHGLFVDCGSGSSESCIKIKKYGGKRKLIALDLSYHALKEGKNITNIDCFINADFFALPFKDNSIDGIYNAGVMEHFTPGQLIEIFNEMARVLKPGAYALFLWARHYSPHNIILGSYSFFMNRVLKRRFWYTPDEILLFRSKKRIKKIVSRSKLKFIKAQPSYRTFLIHELVVCRKP